MNKNEYISTTQAAAFLGVSRVTIFKRIKNGKIAAEKIGRNYVIDRNSLGGIFKIATPVEEKSVKTAMDRVISEFGPALRRLGRE